MKRRHFIVLSSLAITIFCSKCLGDSIFDKKYSREELEKNFYKNHAAFEDAVAIFEADVAKANQQNLTFGLGKWGSVTLLIPPAVIDPANKIIGGEDLAINSPELDSVLTILNWDNETVERLREKLALTNCDRIRTTDTAHHIISMYPNQTGWGSFSYDIFKDPIPDSSIHTSGKPMSDTGFGRRVTLSYTTAL